MQFTYELEESEKGSLEIYDLKGRKLKQYSLTHDQRFIDINLNEVDCGIYFYRFEINNQIVLSNKIVIER